MKFEDALSALRNGKKIRHPSWEKDEYLIGCYVGMIGFEESFEDKKARGMSITKMKGEHIHPEMVGILTINERLDILDKYPKLNKLISSPQLNLLLIMSEDWEILE